MTRKAMPAGQLRDLLVDIAAELTDGDPRRWRRLIGDVHHTSEVDRHRAGWAVIPGGTEDERIVISKAVNVARMVHPFVRP